LTDIVETLIRLLDRQTKETDALAEQLRQARRHEGDAVAHRRRAERDRDAAEAKIDEWIAYSSSWHPLIPRRRLKELTAGVPKPYDREIPF